jgi:hypothetical protein
MSFQDSRPQPLQWTIRLDNSIGHQITKIKKPSRNVKGLFILIIGRGDRIYSGHPALRLPGQRFALFNFVPDKIVNL